MQSHICTQRTTRGSLVSWAPTGPHAVTHLYTADNKRLSGQLGPYRTPCSHTSVHSEQQQALWSAGPLQDPMQSHICTQRTTTGSLVSWAPTGPHAVTHLYTAEQQ
ncbi:hypothetical protein DPMN_019454 [Dreissena polymorpha]|uniref:Uncharacterized protein n=1 Tax=Dreissena polymorpha TaxID=45954 RepID=A0A9D4NF28_DREPO|nr:hypothetical protein DPMN_002962 [Dreissena polymorpha]KAH3895293.1 hypothetical protein DPMN_019454 [Dreissena polymorpha]